MFEVKEKVVLITGGASGIGLEFVKELLKSGIKGAVIADINEELGIEVLAKITEEFGKDRAIFIKTDVTDKVQFEEAFKKTIATFQNLDILINNAGIPNGKLWERVVDVNLGGTITGTLLAFENYLPKYRSGSEGVIVNIASVCGLKGYGSAPVYTATKHAVIGLSLSLGKQEHYDQTKVKILTLCPGLTDTPLLASVTKKQASIGPAYKKCAISEHRSLVLQSPNHVATAIVDLIENGKNGSVWVIEDQDPHYEISMSDKYIHRKQNSSASKKGSD